MGDDIADLTNAWGEPPPWVATPAAVQAQVQAQAQQIYRSLPQLEATLKVGTMKVEIERINNGWLVSANVNPSANDPLGQRGPGGKNFADTPEAICGMIAEWVLSECKRQEGMIK